MSPAVARACGSGGRPKVPVQDKRLYDRIIGQDASAVRDHLRADLSYQSRLVRFLENHDEPRIASRLPADAERAAAMAIATLPGADPVARRTVRGPPGAATSLPLAPSR